MPYTTKARAAVRDLTPVETQSTGEPSFITGRFCGKAVGPAAPNMNPGDLWPDFGKMMTDAICAEPNDI
jgi:hypothetical protein